MIRQLFLFSNRHNYRQLFGVDVNVGLSKADRLVYGDSLMTHAMALTACHFDMVNSHASHVNNEHDNADLLCFM